MTGDVGRRAEGATASRRLLQPHQHGGIGVTIVIGPPPLGHRWCRRGSNGRQERPVASCGVDGSKPQSRAEGNARHHSWIAPAGTTPR